MDPSKLTDAMGSGENFGQVPSNMKGVDNCLDRAMEDVFAGLSKEVDKDAVLNRESADYSTTSIEDVVS